MTKSVFNMPIKGKHWCSNVFRCLNDSDNVHLMKTMNIHQKERLLFFE